MATQRSLALIAWLSLAVILSVVAPFGGVVAAETDADESSTTADESSTPDESSTHDDSSTSDAGAPEQTVDPKDATGGNVETATDATGDTAGAATTATGDTVEAAADANGDVADWDQPNGADTPEPDRSSQAPVADLEQRAGERDGVAVEYSTDRAGSVSIAVDLDQVDAELQLDPDAIDDIGGLLAAIDSEPGVDVVIEPMETVEVDDREPVRRTDQSPQASLSDGAGSAERAGDDEDRAAAGFAPPDPDVHFGSLPTLMTGLFVVVTPLSGALAFLSEWAGRLAAVFRYSRREGSDPLEHETRAEIDDIVDRHPGISLTNLADRLETPLSTVRHHVRTLERERYLATHKQYGHRRLYPVGAENEELAAAMDNDSTATIIESIHEQGQATVGDIVDDVGTTYSTVSHHLSRLAESGIVQKEKEGRCTVSELAPSVRSVLGGDRDPTSVPPATRPSNAD